MGECCSRVFSSNSSIAQLATPKASPPTNIIDSPQLDINCIVVEYENVAKWNNV
jgi:hypothetical protein